MGDRLFRCNSISQNVQLSVRNVLGLVDGLGEACMVGEMGVESCGSLVDSFYTLDTIDMALVSASDAAGIPAMMRWQRTSEQAAQD